MHPDDGSRGGEGGLLLVAGILCLLIAPFAVLWLAHYRTAVPAFLAVLAVVGVGWLTWTLGGYIGHMPRKARLGADGFSFADNFVSYAAISETRFGGASRFSLLIPGHYLFVFSGRVEGIEAARRLVAEGRERHVARVEGEVEHRLARGADEEEETWRERVAGMWAEAYRDVAVDRARVWDVLVDDAAEPSARVAAASVLLPLLDPRERAHVKKRAKFAAHPGVRAALKAAGHAPADREAAGATRARS